MKKKIFPRTIFSNPKLKDTSAKEVLAEYLSCVEKYPYNINEKGLLQELIRLVWFSNEKVVAFFDDKDPIRLLAYRMKTAYEFDKNPKKKLVDIIPSVDGNPKKIYPRVFHILEGQGDEKQFSLLMDFVKRELAQYPSKDAQHIIKTYENYREVMKGLKRIDLIKDAMELHPVESFLFGHEPKLGDMGVSEGVYEKEYDIEAWLEEWTPFKLVEYLDQYVIGQKEAKITAAMVAYTHVVQLSRPEETHRKSYCLFYGPSGSGKTYIWKKLAEIMPVSLTQVDCSLFSPAGYQGSEVSDMLQALTIGRRKGSILLLDEFDKLCKNDINTDQKSAGQTQANFLKIMDGGQLNVGKRTIDASDFLLVFVGAFTDIFHQREEKSKIGFLHVDSDEAQRESVSDDEFLRSYHMLPELLGRIDYKAYCRKLGIDDFVKICKLPNGAVQELKHVYQQLGWN